MPSAPGETKNTKRGTFLFTDIKNINTTADMKHTIAKPDNSRRRNWYACKPERSAHEQTTCNRDNIVAVEFIRNYPDKQLHSKRAEVIYQYTYIPVR